MTWPDFLWDVASNTLATMIGDTPFEEYCFMISFLDRIFLKVFAYSGKYFDWRDFPNERTRRDLE